MDTPKILSDSDYRQFRSGDIKSWSGEKLSQFLIWDFPNVYANTSVLGKDAIKSISRNVNIFREKYRKYIFILNFIDWFFAKLMLIFGKNQNHLKILFQPLKGDFIINEVKKHRSIGLIAQGRKDRLFAIKNFIGYIGTTDLYKYIDNYMKDGNTKHLYKLVEKTENKLKTVKPDYIALGLDSLPIDRAIIWVAKKLGIPTLVIQHGTENFSLPVFDGKAADYNLVWGEYFKDLYIKQVGLKPENIYILGYPCPIDNNSETEDKSGPYAVCYLGQDYERYNKDFLVIKLETIKQLSLICKKLGLKFIYRPHPGDNRDMLMGELSDIYFTPKGEKVEETFKTADIFISSCSTASIEAAMRSRVSLQLMNYPLKSDNFEQLGVCSKTFEKIDELEDYLAKMAGAPDLKEFKVKFNNNYIETKYKPAQRFMEIINEIEKFKNNGNNKKI